ncbi:hypothetical protein HAX54_026681 [Datura stramonium]|uniref:Uncharacterized protein n=1 Tax=Datura stramonium TaxID=4076 RepID=A0ABS8S826_DATST|nr:hypothetical protein [Datura stramonium]
MACVIGGVVGKIIEEKYGCAAVLMPLPAEADKRKGGRSSGNGVFRPVVANFGGFPASERREGKVSLVSAIREEGEKEEGWWLVAATGYSPEKRGMKGRGKVAGVFAGEEKVKGRKGLFW